MDRTKTVVLGKGDLAVKIAEWFHRSPNHDLIMVVPVMPEPGWCESFSDWARLNHVHVVASGDYKSIENRKFDLAISVYYDKIISQRFIDNCGVILNLHNAPLPKYRGVRPINWALKNQETEHGVTIHEIEAGIDCGPIYGQVKFGIDHKIDEVRDVYDRCLYHGWELFLDVMENLDSITPKPQDETKATYYSAKQNCELWERSGWTKEESMPEYFRQSERLLSDFADRLVTG